MKFPHSVSPSGRLIGTYSTGEPGPLMLAMGGIHGNEPSGVVAIERVIRQLQRDQPPISGCFVGLIGNRLALKRKTRGVDEDLNRCFKFSRVKAPLTEGASSEQHELKEIIAIINELARDFEDICFVDCHTTSSMTVPYISVNAHTESLSLARNFPLSSVVGLEKSIPGCFGEYCNKLNYRGFTVEGGQHDELASIENHEAVLWLLLANSGAMHKNDIEDFDHYEESLAKNTTHGIEHYQLVMHYRIDDGEGFVMEPGYVNFEKVKKGELLATNRFGDIHSPCDARILMPLYQKQGDDGFFLLEEDEVVESERVLEPTERMDVPSHL